MPIFNSRSAKTGKFVTAKHAKANPNSTVREVRGPPKLELLVCDAVEHIKRLLTSDDPSVKQDAEKFLGDNGFLDRI